MDLVKVDPVFNLYDRDWPIRTFYPPTPPAKTVFNDSQPTRRIGATYDSLVSAGCIISGGEVFRSILSPGVHIHSYSQVSESILMDDVDVGRHARVRSAIVDKGVRIPPGYRIGFDPEEDAKKYTLSPSGVVVIPKGTILT
jgi:glucose-1-phosphate adenylyltransferase